MSGPWPRRGGIRQGAFSGIHLSQLGATYGLRKEYDYLCKKAANTEPAHATRPQFQGFIWTVLSWVLGFEVDVFRVGFGSKLQGTCN